MATFVIIYCIAACLFWLGFYFYATYAMLVLPDFHTLNPPQPAYLPKLSVIVAACDEAHTIEAAARTLLAQDYPQLEVILINDRSSDSTGAIIDRLAGEDPRIRAVHITHLPPGWLGKVHAHQVGARQANGKWLLFTDADVHFNPGVLCKAVAFALAQQADHLSLLPRPVSHSFWLDVLVRTFGLLVLVNTRAVQAGNDDSPAAIGIGAFNLVRRRLFDELGGLEWLRMEVGDDVGLGLMIKRAGGRSRFALADRDIRVEWYQSVGAMFRGVEKNLFGPGAHYSLLRLLMLLALLYGALAAPLVALMYPVSWLWTAGVGVSITIIISSGLLYFRVGSGMGKFLLSPVAIAIIGLMLLRSGLACLWRGGIIWRGTLYPTRELKAGQRLKF